MSADALKLLNDVAFGIAFAAGIPKHATVTIELDYESALRLGDAIAISLLPAMRASGLVEPPVELGRPFRFRGIDFRIVERAQCD